MPAIPKVREAALAGTTGSLVAWDPVAKKERWRVDFDGPWNGGTLSTWPGCKGGPPILIGAWRSPRWITYAAKQAQGWTPSGRFSSWDDLEYGMKIYREAGGTNAVLANCSIDLAERPESAELVKVASVNFICSPEEARRRIKRVEQLGFEEILIGSQFGSIDEIERVRDFLNS